MSTDSGAVLIQCGQKPTICPAQQSLKVEAKLSVGIPASTVCIHVHSVNYRLSDELPAELLHLVVLPSQSTVHHAIGSILKSAQEPEGFANVFVDRLRQTMRVPARLAPTYAKNSFEPFSLSCFERIAKESTQILDIGSHVGAYSVAARLANRDATIFAVEANPLIIPTLSENTATANVRLIYGFFGGSQAETVIQLAEASDNCGAFGHPNSPTVGLATVPSVSESAFYPDENTLVKVDIEGNEFGALEGILRLKHKSKSLKLVIEFNPKLLRLANSDPAEFLSRLESNFQVFAILENEGRLGRLGQARDGLLSSQSYSNLLCLPPETILVAAVLHSGEMGGSERSHIEMCQQLSGVNVEVHSVIPGSTSPLEQGLRVLGFSATPTLEHEWWTNQASGLRGTGAVDRNVGSLEPDIILTQTSVLPQGAIVAAARGIPHVWYLREFGKSDHDLQLPVEADDFGRLVRQLSAAIFTNSRGVADHFFPDFGPAHKVSTVYPSPRLQDSPAESQNSHDFDRSSTKDGSCVFGIIGTIQPSKGQLLAIEAIRGLREVGVEAELKIFGAAADPAYMELLHEHVLEHSLSHLVYFCGPVEPMEALESVDVVILASAREAFGRVPFEATDAGKPVIFSLSGGFREYMIDGVTGLGFEPMNAHALAAAMKAFASSELLRARMAQTAKSYLQAFRSTPDRGRQMRRLFESAIEDFEPVDVSTRVFAQMLVLGADRLSVTGAERDGLMADRDALIANRDALTAERDALTAERDALTAERDWWFVQFVQLGERRSVRLALALARRCGFLLKARRRRPRRR